MTDAVDSATLLDRAEGGMLGAALGDALGWPQERRAGRVGGSRNVEPRLELSGWRRREGTRYQNHEEEISAGSYSDDTQLILAVGRALLRGERWWESFARVELPFWSMYERGGGGATKRAASSWSKGKPPWLGPDAQRYFDAGGNGVAMRVLPHALVASSDDSFDAAGERIVRDGIATHGHPRALVGALLVGFLAWRLLRSTRVLEYGELLEDAARDNAWREFRPASDLPDWLAAADHSVGLLYSKVWTETVKETEDLLDVARNGIEKGSLAIDRQTLDEIGCFDRRMLGAGTSSAVGAAFLASRYAVQPAQGVLAAAYARGADTDTLAAMAGGLLGVINGADWVLPIAEGVQDARYLREMAGRLVRQEVTENGQLPEWRASLPRRFWAEFEKAHAGMEVRLPDRRSGTVMDVVDHTSRLPSVRARTWVVYTDDGQTLHLKRVQRLKPPERGLASPPRERPYRIGMVLRVHHMEGMVRFYTELVGLQVSRRSRSYTSFEGLLALEAAPASRDEREDQLLLGSGGAESADPFDSNCALTVFLFGPDLDKTRARLEGARVPLTAFFETNGRRVFRCLDPERNVIEFRERNGS